MFNHASQEAQFQAYSRFNTTRHSTLELQAFKQDLALYFDENCIDKPELEKFGVATILEYLIQTHSFYRDILMPKMQMAIWSFDKNFPDHPASEVLKLFYFNYQNELLEHIDLEESKLFPYVENLQKGKVDISYSVKQFRQEHNHEIEDQLEAVVETMKEKYPEITSELAFRTFEHLLALFSKDLAVHHYIEEQIFVKKVASLELIQLT